MVRAAVFLDRDGVIIENRADYVKSWEEVRFLPGVFKALQKLAQSPYLLVLATNQSVVGRGIISPANALEINRGIIAAIESQGGRMDASYLCFHHPTEGCHCRKPAPGLLLRAKKELALELKKSYLVGDAASDMGAAQAVGAQGIIVLTGRGKEQLEILKKEGPTNCVVAANLAAAVEHILAQGEFSL